MTAVASDAFASGAYRPVPARHAPRSRPAARRDDRVDGRREPRAHPAPPARADRHGPRRRRGLRRGLRPARHRGRRRVVRTRTGGAQQVRPPHMRARARLSPPQSRAGGGGVHRVHGQAPGGYQDVVGGLRTSRAVAVWRYSCLAQRLTRRARSRSTWRSRTACSARV
jgi:hypothetical protein